VSVALQQVLAGHLGVRFGARPAIPLPDDDEMLSETASLLLQNVREKGIYRRDSVVVYPYAPKRRLEMMTAQTFRTWVEVKGGVACVKTRYDRSGDPYQVVRTMPKEVAEGVLQSVAFWPELPEIARVAAVPMPVVRSWDDDGWPTGAIDLLQPGYDHQAEIFTFDIPSSYEEMTLAEASEYLRSIYEHFPFSDWTEVGGVRNSRSLAVQIATALGQFARFLLPKGTLRLGTIYNANSQRSGKSLLLKMSVIPVAGELAAQSWKSDDDELRKALDSEVLRGSSYIVFDNVRGHVSSPTLEGFMTSPTWTGRVLGESRMFTADNDVTVYLTGNECTTSTDINHRCLFVDLFVAEAAIQDRKVPRVIDDAWLLDWKNRRKILSALWAIVRAWDQAGRPRATGKLRNGFERWCGIMGGMVEVAGFGDALGEVEIDGAGDTQDRDLRLLVEALALEGYEKGLTTYEFSFQHIVNRAKELEVFDWLLDGKWIDREGGEKAFQLKPDCQTKFSRIIGRAAPAAGGEMAKRRLYVFGAGDRVFFWRSGKTKNHYRYCIEVSLT